MHVGVDEQSFAHKLLGYLQETDYRVADTEADRQPIYRLRYDAYLREGAIESDPSAVLHDKYDDLENCWIFGVYIDGCLISSIRLHIISPEMPWGPAIDVFPELVEPMIDKGLVLVDPSRFVADEEATKLYPELPYLTLRAACMASEYFRANYCLSTVRSEHRAFYRRVFKSTILCEPRPYLTLKKPLCLMTADVAAIRDKLMRRYPIFESSFTERRMIFEQRALQGIDRKLIPSIPMEIPSIERYG